jgi:G patch domain-containing protein 1
MSSSDDDEYVYIGTPLVDEEDARVGARKQALDPSLTRSRPVHQQEVTDEQGRKRFHGAFTGGFSAGYYNTVGSKVGGIHELNSMHLVAGNYSQQWHPRAPS